MRFCYRKAEDVERIRCFVRGAILLAWIPTHIHKLQQIIAVLWSAF